MERNEPALGGTGRRRRREDAEREGSLRMRGGIRASGEGFATHSATPVRKLRSAGSGISLLTATQAGKSASKRRTSAPAGPVETSRSSPSRRQRDPLLAEAGARHRAGSRRGHGTDFGFLAARRRERRPLLGGAQETSAAPGRGGGRGGSSTQASKEKPGRSSRARSLGKVRGWEGGKSPTRGSPTGLPPPKRTPVMGGGEAAPASPAPPGWGERAAGPPGPRCAPGRGERAAGPPQAPATPPVFRPQGPSGPGHSAGAGEDAGPVAGGAAGEGGRAGRWHRGEGSPEEDAFDDLPGVGRRLLPLRLGRSRRRRRLAATGAPVAGHLRGGEGRTVPSAERDAPLRSRPPHPRGRPQPVPAPGPARAPPPPPPPPSPAPPSCCAAAPAALARPAAAAT